MFKDKFVAIRVENLQHKLPNVEHKEWCRVEIKRLIDCGEIPPHIDKQCHKHCINYQAKPLTIFGSKNEVWYSQCPECNDEITRQRERKNEVEFKQNEAKSKKDMEATLLLRGVPPIYFNKIVEYNKGLFVKHSHLLQSKLDKNYLIFGNIGIGKSTFAYELCKSYYQKGLHAEVINANVLMGKFKANYSNIEILQSNFKYVNLLIIDEIDNIKAIDYSLIDDLISYFYDNNKRLIFIGNADRDAFKELLSPKSNSRLKGQTEMLSAVGNDLRLEAI